MTRPTGSVIPKGVPFGQLPHAINEDHAVTNAGYRVYGQLVKLANSESRAWPGHRYLEDTLPMTRKTIASAISNLEETGWLIVNRSKQHHTYVVVVELARLDLEWDDTNRGKKDTGGIITPEQNVPQTGVEVTHEPVELLPHTDTQDRQPKTDTLAASPTKSIDARNAAWDFLTHAELFNLPATTKAQQRRVGKLARELNASLEHAAVDGTFSWHDAMSEMNVRANTWPEHFPDATMTADAFVKHFELLGAPPVKRSKSDQTRVDARAAIAELADRIPDDQRLRR